MAESKTNVASGATGAMIQQAVGVFHTCMQRNTTLNRLTGKMPTIENARIVTTGTTGRSTSAAR